MRQINDAGLTLIKDREGLRLHAYPDTGGVWTIGYGHTRGVYPGQSCSRGQAETWLREDLSASEATVSAAVRVDLTDDQFAALVDFVYNVGATTFRRSTLLRVLNRGQYNRVPAELHKYVHDRKGRRDNGLVSRRAAEGVLFMTADPQSVTAEADATIPPWTQSVFSTDTITAVAPAGASILGVLNNPGPMQWAIAISIVVCTAGAVVYLLLRRR